MASVPQIEYEKTGHFGVDIGGSLCKICFYEPKNDKNLTKLKEFVLKNNTYGSTGKRDTNLILTSPYGRFHFILFETERIRQAIEMIINEELLTQPSGPLLINVTGGGAEKLSSLLKSLIPEKATTLTDIRKKDEMLSLVNGLNFLLKHLDQELFYYPIPNPQHPSIDFSLEIQKVYINTKESEIFPYLLVNIGTGVSILRVDENGTYERISGSGLGGGTYWGLVKKLTGIQSFDQSLLLARKGKSEKIDMTVGDIYGGDYVSLGLNSTMTASFFGKWIQNSHNKSSNEDICHATLLMVTNNIGQIAYLLAQLHQLKHIVFSGSFLRHDSDLCTASVALARAIAFWSKNTMKACFLTHEGYCGALGALIHDS